jgi:predicted NUDIX family NTP pyrophosphohydrolase
MALKQSAGLLLFRRPHSRLEVLLAHPGGPVWATRHVGAWTIPKGGANEGETLLDAAIREFREETGFLAAGPYLPLGQVTQRGGKVVHGWAFEGDCDPASMASETTTTEWPPRSGRMIVVPEIDRVEFFDLDRAKEAINVAQIELLDRLVSALQVQV